MVDGIATSQPATGVAAVPAVAADPADAVSSAATDEAGAAGRVRPAAGGQDAESAVGPVPSFLVLADDLPDGLVIADHAGTVTVVNRAAA
ncbi:MAG TPA: hypothetical protein VEH05_11595, partial [Streptosporangiaceae bacterium]|nr:hypothetical protein [Streptosporangiaceae bacterium]